MKALLVPYLCLGLGFLSGHYFGAKARTQAGIDARAKAVRAFLDEKVAVVGPLVLTNLSSLEGKIIVQIVRSPPVLTLYGSSNTTVSGNTFLREEDIGAVISLGSSRE